MADKIEFQKTSEVRKFLKENGFLKVKVRFGRAPFSGCPDLFFVGLTDIPEGVTLVTAGGSLTSTRTFGNHAPTVKRIAELRELLNSRTLNAKAGD